MIFGFSPTETVLTTTDEFKNVRFSITYKDTLGVSIPVTVTAIDPNSTINVSGNSISGYYSNSFPDTTIEYRTQQDTFVTVNNFDEIGQDVYGVYYYRADRTVSRTYSYIATADGNTKIYTVIVLNNWDYGKNTLVRYINPNYKTVTWVNIDGTEVKWINNQNKEVSWDNNQ
jgi:hypothetical protein